VAGQSSEFATPPAALTRGQVAISLLGAAQGIAWQGLPTASEIATWDFARGDLV
jgi:hypothetical protein